MMNSNRMRTNLKLAKLFYKYLDEPKEQTAVEPETTQLEEKDYDSYPPYNFSWFIENKVAAMGWPQTVENLNYLADAGVNHLITLSPERRPPILECKKKLKWSEIRIKEFGTPTLKQILKFIEICERAEIRGEVIGVHCRHGRGRTGTLLACYLVHFRDMAPERAVLTVRVQRPGEFVPITYIWSGGYTEDASTLLACYLVHFRDMAPERAVLTVRVQRPGSCETYEQEKIVCHYHDCMRGTISKPDYRLVEDKLYFDYSMKHNYSDDEDSKDEAETDEFAELTKDDPKKIVETLQLKKKSKAMVINHHIYF